MATLPGEPVYSALGFHVVERKAIEPNGVTVPFVHMRRDITRRS
jgi:hypothetical protein